MAPGDLQVVGLWTDPRRRGEGLALLALQDLFHRLADSRRVVWYLAKEGNRASLRLAEKAGFQFRGMGERREWLGLGLTGRFHLDVPGEPGQSSS
jgi:RimJ/RimL family protein N-acetyltransferase